MIISESIKFLNLIIKKNKKLKTKNNFLIIMFIQKLDQITN